MNTCTEFMQLILKVSYEEPYLILVEDVMPQLTRYVTLIHGAEFADGSYESYYRELTKYISSFLDYWNSVIDDIIQEADKCTNNMNRKEFLILVDQTIDVHQTRQIVFGKEFLPVQSQHEKQTFELMEELFYQHIKNLDNLKGTIERLDKQEKVDSFLKEHFKLSIKGTAELFKATHVFISMMLAEQLNNIRVSLEEILLRVRNNLREIQSRGDEILNALLRQLHDKNKELLMITRQQCHSSTDYAEIDYSIARIREKIAEHSFDPSLSGLQEEEAYWQRRLDDFHKTSAGLLQLIKEQEDVAKQEQIYNSLQTLTDGSKKLCWLNIGVNFAERKKILKEKIIEAAKLLVTHFAVRGTDHILYKDDVGRYFVDEFNRQVYLFDYGLKTFHRNSDGELFEVSDSHNYYFDTFDCLKGEKGKVNQCGPSSSQYQSIVANSKTLQHCGHSGMEQNFGLHVQDGRTSNVGEILSKVNVVKTEGFLASEVVKYLWDSFGHALPDALHDAGHVRAHYPLHHLAHSLLLRKYMQTKTEYEKKIKDAAEYRANIFKERKEKATAACEAWKCRQMKRVKPEELDARDEDVVRHAQRALATLALANQVE